MPQLDRASWERALRFLDEAYTIAMVGPRLHDDWRADVPALMRREAPDPRGWTGLVPEEADRAAEGPFHPFTPPSAGSLDANLFPICPESAARQLVIMSGDTFRFADVHGYPENEEGLLADARTVLERFTPDGKLYTNCSTCAVPSGDFPQRIEAASPLSRYFDVGLFAVTDDEVGLFWAFDAR